MKKILSRIFLLVALTVLSLPVRAEDAGTIKQRMSARIGQIDSVKSKGVVGETNGGLLQVRGNASGEEQELVAAENKDRSEVYAAIAQKAGSSADAVARARAKKIAETSSAGVWLQDDAGNWYQKK